jgi:predicted nucleic acid-binding Zn ribbon protein
MVMQCADQWNEDVETIPSRRCGECGHDMTLAVALPRLGALPALRSYRCTMCGNVELDVLEHFGPRPRDAAVRQCPEPEVRTRHAARKVANFGFKGALES